MDRIAKKSGTAAVILAVCGILAGEAWAAEMAAPDTTKLTPATIAWGEAVSGVQAGLVPLGPNGRWIPSFQCGCDALRRHAMPSPEEKEKAAKTRCCELCGAPKPWSATFVEGKPLAFEVHMRNTGDKTLIVGGVHRWFTFVFTPAGGGVPRQATYTSQALEAPPGQRDLPGKGYLAFVEGVGGTSPSGTWRFEDARPNRDGSLRPIPVLPPGKYSVTARYGDAHPEHAPDAVCRFWHGKIATGAVEIEIKPGEPEPEAQRKDGPDADAKTQVDRRQEIQERELRQRAMEERGQ
jgi:hypothetical protein